MSAAPRFIALVVEGPSDARVVPSVVDRILVERETALEGNVESAYTFGGFIAASTFLAWHSVDPEAKGRVPRRHGPFKIARRSAGSKWTSRICAREARRMASRISSVRSRRGSCRCELGRAALVSASLARPHPPGGKLALDSIPRVPMNRAMLLIRKNGVTSSEIIPHQPRKNVVNVNRQNTLSMHRLQRFPSTVFEARATIIPMF
jgi:hypothetical protein